MSRRRIATQVPAMPASDGAGVKLKRAIGTPALDHVDPLLLLDEFHSDDPDAYIAGFPDHPHRGFETVTYMLAGAMRHRDHLGNEGHLGPGSVQWMTAGRGIVHSEMPMQEQGLLRGFQLWINLPAEDKLCEPRYQEYAASEIPIERFPGGQAKLIAGSVGASQGPVQPGATEPLYWDVTLEPGGRFEQTVPAEHTICLYLYDGAAQLEGQDLAAESTTVTEPGETLAIESAEGCGVLVIGAKPLKEPIARYGPFVMNNREELEQAFDDFRNGRF